MDRHALRSIAQQPIQPHEIIVIDDASTDNSLAQIGQSGVPVKLLQVNARNAAVARNAGIKAATGDWIALLDADDVWYPNHLARAAELLSKTNDVAFMSNHDWIGLQSELLPLPEEFRCKLTAPRSGMDVEQFFELIENGSISVTRPCFTASIAYALSACSIRANGVATTVTCGSA